MKSINILIELFFNLYYKHLKHIKHITFIFHKIDEIIVRTVINKSGEIFLSMSSQGAIKFHISRCIKFGGS